MTQINREVSRDYLALLLEASLVTDLEIVQVVYNRKVSNFQGQSPMVAVLSAGTGREYLTMGNMVPRFLYEVQSWVLYADPNAIPPWTEALAEDRLDLIERRIAEVIEANLVVEGYWDELCFSGPSTIADVTVIGGDSYLLERIPVYTQIY